MPNVLSYTMGLENRGFLSPLRAAEGGISHFASKAATALGAIGVSLAAFKSVEGIVGGLTNVAEKGRDLNTLSKITGQSIRDLSGLQKAFQEAGIGAESLPQTLRMMQAALGGVNEQGEPTKKMFEQLGLSIDDLKGRSAVEQLDMMGRAIGSLKDQETKVAAARAIFGRSGADVLALFANPQGTREAIREGRELGEVYQRNAGTFTHIALTLEKLKGSVAKIFVGMMDQIAEPLSGFLDRLKAGFNGLKIGESIGHALRVAAEALKEGELGTLLGLSIQVGLERTLPSLANSFLDAFKKPIAYLQAMIEAALSSAGRGVDNWVDEKAIALLQASQDKLAKRGYMSPDIDGLIKSHQAAIDNRNKQSGVDIDKRAAELEKFYGSRPFNVSPDTFKENALKTLVAELQAMLKPLGIAVAEVSQTAGGRSFDVTAKGGAKIVEGDRLAKIGGFIGGGKQRMEDYARRSAVALEKMLANKDHYPGGKFIPAPRAVWA